MQDVDSGLMIPMWNWHQVPRVCAAFSTEYHRVSRDRHILHHCWFPMLLNTLRARQYGYRFPNDIFKCIFVNENVLILIEISLKFVPKVQINDIQALVQIMAGCPLGDMPLSGPVTVSSLMHICVTRPQWVHTIFEHLLRDIIITEYSLHIVQASSWVCMYLKALW